jgi:SnoaL-like protein
MTPGPIELRLARLEAAEAIRKAIYSYAVAGDRANDPASVRLLFSANATFEAKGMGRFEGLDNIVHGLAEIARTVVIWSFHAPSGPWIDLSEDAARARVFWWVWVPTVLRSEDGTNTPHWGAGQYNAEMASEEGIWKFTRLLFETRLRTPFAGPWTQVDGPFEWPR